MPVLPSHEFGAGRPLSLVKCVFTDPHQSVLLVHTKVEVLDESLRRKLRLYALLAPHIAGLAPATPAVVLKWAVSSSSTPSAKTFT